MDSLDLITQLEGKLKAAINLEPLPGDSWRLSLRLVYDGEPAGTLSFNLNGYNPEEARDIARNVSSNAFLMREIDEFLWGESD